MCRMHHCQLTKRAARERDRQLLIDQPHVNADKHDGKTIGELQNQIAATTGENVVIRRFSRFVIGE